MLSIIKEIAQRLRLAVALFLYAMKGGADMMAMLWTQQILLDKKTFEQVPDKLKEQVRELLIDSGCGDLVTE